jgi:uncharacterized repeat protein (TIGR01451 family)
MNALFSRIRNFFHTNTGRQGVQILQNGVLIAFVFFQITGALTALGSYVQNDNSGYFLVDFNNDQQGVVAEGDPGRQDTEIDTIVGVAKVAAGKTTGYFTTADIRPNSFTKWNTVELDANYSGATDVVVSLYECDLTPISGFQNLTLAGGMYNIGSLSATTYPCIKVRVDMTNGVTPPTINSLRVTWNPLPGYLITMTTPASVPAGANLGVDVNYSISYVDDVNTVVWIPVPTMASGISNYNNLYNQNPALTFVSASNGGQYTASSIAVNGVTVPAGSVYWSLGNVAAGQSGTLNMQLQTTNGWQSGMQFNFSAHIDSLRGNATVSDLDPFTAGVQQYITQITSTPDPTIEKNVSGTALIGDKHYVVNAAGYTPIVTYTVTLSNSFTGTGRETIFNPTITDNLTNIMTNLQNVCGVGTPASRITPLGGGLLSGNTITWDTVSGDITHIVPGGTQTVSYTVDYTGCPEDGVTTYGNVAGAFSDNISFIDDSLTLYVGVDNDPKGNFAKGDKVNGTLQVTAGKDDNQYQSQTYGQSFSYELLMQNRGAVVLGDNALRDNIPLGLTFISASLPPASNGTLYYNTSAAAPDPTLVPGTGFSAANGWTSTAPTDPTTVRAVAVYVPCLNSALFPAPGSNAVCTGTPAAVTAEITVSIDTPGDICLDTEYTNIGQYTFSAASPTYANTALAPLGTPITSTDSEPTHASPSLAAFSQNSSITGASTVMTGQSITYTLTVTNTGSDTAQGATVTIPTPQIPVNGVPTYIDFVQMLGGSVSTASLPGSVSTTLGTIPVGTSKTVTVTYMIPSGVKNNDTFTVNATVSATDDNNCRTITSNLARTTSVTSRPELHIVKNAEESVVSGGEDINYDISFANIGNAPTTQTYIIDRIPAQSVFKEAYTSGTNANLVAFSCIGCKVYFSNSPSLPPSLSILQPLNTQAITNYFSLGTETTPGTWVPVGIPASSVTWVAWNLDDPSLGDILPTGVTGKVGLTVTNDDDTSTPGIDPSPIGTIVSNAPAIFSSDLLQAIANQVFTTILPNPGLRISKTSDKEVLYAGESFNWNIEYYNDSGNPDTSVTLTDTVPAGAIPTAIYHTWNAKAVSNGATPGTEVDVTASPFVTMTPNPDGTTTIVLDVTGMRGGDLEHIEGGTLRIATDTATTLVSGDILLNSVLGCFANPSGNFCISTQDTVAIVNPDMWIRKQVDITDPIAGETVNYTLIVSNEGGHDAENVLISDTLPAGLCYAGPTQVTTSGWSLGAPVVTGGPCASAPTTLTWSISNGNNINNPTYTPPGTVPANSADIYIRYAVNVNAAVPPGTLLTNGAHVENSIIEDPIYPNDTSADIETPLPDPYVTKDAQLTVEPGATATYTITYGNNTRETATGVYLIDTFPIIGYPDYASHPTTDMKFVSASGTRGEVFYYHDGPLSVTPPVFDPTAPTVGGWSATPNTNTAFMAIVIPSNQLDGQVGPYSISVNFQAVHPSTNTNLPAGLTLTNRVEIFSTTVDDDDTNNIASAATNTPGLDLAINKVGSVEGGFPGIAPGAPITYDITVSNRGTVDACAVYVEDTLGAGITMIAPYHNFTTLALKDQTGVAVTPHDTSGNPLSGPVNITYNGTDNRWELGSTSTTPYTNVCIPPGSSQTFQVFAQIDASAADSTIATNIAVVGEDSAANEDITSNNIDDTSVSIYKPDLMIQKTGFSCGPDNTCGNSDDSPTTVNQGEIIQYEISYDNIGNIDAENPIIVEPIPNGTCFVEGSVTAPPGGKVEYSIDGGSTWYGDDIIPGGFGLGCSVTHVRIVFTSAMPAPSHFDAENEISDFGGTKINVQDVTVASGGALTLSSTGLPSNSGISKRTRPVVSDFDGDGKIDVALTDSENMSPVPLDVLRNTSVPGALTFATGASMNFMAVTGSIITDFAMSDFNGDGKQDFALVNDEMVVMKNTSVPGTMQFVNEFQYDGLHSFGTEHFVANGLYVGDMTNDSKPDVFMYGTMGGRVCINTTASFGVLFAPITFTCTPSTVGSWVNTSGGSGDVMFEGGAPRVFADFNNDGDTDVVGLFSQSFGQVRAYTNDISDTPSLQSGTFDLTSAFGVGGATLYGEAQAVDFDGDGFKDVVLGVPLRVLRNTTASVGVDVTFVNVPSPALPLVTGNYTVADVNNDGLPDIVTSNDIPGSTTPRQHVLVNTSSVGSISFTDVPINSGIYAGGAPVVTDFNNDGVKDIAFVGFDYNVGSSTYTQGHTKIYRNTTDTVADASNVTFTLDSTADIVGAFNWDLVPHNGNTCFNCADYQLDHAASAIDIDGDFIDDLVLNGGPNHSPSILRNSSSTSGGPLVFDFYSKFGTFGMFSGNNIANFDSDPLGLPDIIFDEYPNSRKLGGYVNNSFVGAVKFDAAESVYASTGTYDTVIQGSGVTAWNKLQVIQTLPANTDIKYSLYDDSFGTLLMAPTSAPLGYIDIASFTSGYQTLGLRVDFTTTNPVVTPTLEGWRATYASTNIDKFNFQVTVNTGITLSSISNTATISTTTPEIRTDNNTDSYQLFLNRADLAITKDVDATVVEPSDIMTYTLSYVNNGPNDALNVTIEDLLPVDVDTPPISITATPTSLGDTVSCSYGPSLPYFAGAVGILCNGGADQLNLSTGESGTITVRVRVAAGTPVNTILKNDVHIGSFTLDTNPLNNDDSVTSIVNNLANVYITKTGPTSATIDGDIVYTITYGNNGNLPAVNVTIVDAYDPNTTFSSAIQTSGSPALLCGAFPAGSVTCNSTGALGGAGVTLAPGATGTLQIRMHVNNDISLVVNNEIIENTVTIATTTPEFTIVDNVDTFEVPILPAGASSLSGRVFYDGNANVIQDMLDVPISPVEVFLAGVDIYGNVYGPDKVLYPGEYENAMATLLADSLIPAGSYLSTDPYPSNFVVIDPETVNLLGMYSFGGLAQGVYAVFESQPGAYLSTGSNAGYMSTDMLGNPVYSPATDGLGSVETGNAGDNNQITTIILGDATNGREYNFGEANGSIGDLVFIDTSGTPGIFDGSDAGIGGVTIALYTDTNSNGVIDVGEPSRSTTTNSSGAYQFSNLALNVSYIVRVTDTGNVVGTYNAILGTAGTNNNGQNPMGYVVALTSGTPINNTADFAYGTTTPGGTTGTGGGTGGTTGTTGCEPNCPSSTSGSIGNLVFWDKDLDGIFNHSDIGIGGVEVTLYTDTNKNGVVDPGEPSQTRLTSLDPNDSGLYQFIGLDISNHYIVKVTDTLTLPSFGFEPSIVSGAGNQDNFSKDPTGYVVTTLSTSPSDQTADFGWKTTQILPETGQKRLMYGIVIVSVLVLGAFITLRRRKAI